MVIHGMADLLPFGTVGLCKVTITDEPTLPGRPQNRTVACLQIQCVAHGSSVSMDVHWCSQKVEFSHRLARLPGQRGESASRPRPPDGGADCGPPPRSCPSNRAASLACH